MSLLLIYWYHWYLIQFELAQARSRLKTLCAENLRLLYSRSLIVDGKTRELNLNIQQVSDESFLRLGYGAMYPSFPPCSEIIAKTCNCKDKDRKVTYSFLDTPQSMYR